jgi:cation diffusion facilitator CzcD-associated flavoprotein CzcO
VPKLAQTAKEVVVFQRSPNYITPRQDMVISPFRRTMYRYVPWVRRQYRAQLMDTREAYWKVLVDTDGEAHQAVKEISAKQLHDQLPGLDRVELREVLTPRYPPGCKRILISDDYYPALGEPHVTLETAAIAKVTETGIQVSSGWNSRQGAHELLEHDFDVVVCATGFQATQFLTPMRVEIKGGDSLPRKWEDGAYAYKGLMVPSIYNFAMMYGPNTNLGHNSIILMIEAQSAYINRLIQAVCANYGPAQGSYLRIAPRESITRAFNAKLQASLGKSTLASDQCSSWYKSETGIITTNWSEDVIEYQSQLSTLEWQDYELDGPGSQRLRSQERVKWARVVEESQSWVPGLVNLSSVALVLGIGTAMALAVISRGRLIL